jgi:hypothetical protein
MEEVPRREVRHDHQLEVQASGRQQRSEGIIADLQVLQKVSNDEAQVVLIHPDWPGALWRPLLNRMTRFRIPLPTTADLLRYPTNRNLRHPMKKLSLVASWIVGA